MDKNQMGQEDQEQKPELGKEEEKEESYAHDVPPTEKKQQSKDDPSGDPESEEDIGEDL